MTEVVAFLRGCREAVVSSLAADGAPQSAVVGIAVSDGGEIVFDTLGDTRKAANLRRDPRVALTAWHGEKTVQIEGLADEPAGAERERLVAVYLGAFPDGAERLKWPGITHFRITPRWTRSTDFGVSPPAIVEFG
jgi:PPOX class probable F420-dependent enzyme